MTKLICEVARANLLETLLIATQTRALLSFRNIFQQVSSPNGWNVFAFFFVKI